jgi:GAF domain-containing protein
MSYRTKLTILMLVIGLTPLAIVVYQGYQELNQTSTSASTVLQPALEKLSTQSIINTSGLISQQLLGYLQNHPEIDSTDNESLIADGVLSQITAQSVGKNGYTMVFNNKMIVVSHIDAQQVGTNLDDLQSRSPGYWSYLSNSTKKSHTSGYFNQMDSARQITAFISIDRVGDTPLFVAAVAEASEFNQPVSVARTNFQNTVNRSILLFVSVSAVAALAAVAGSFWLGKKSTSDLVNLVEDTYQLASRLPEPVSLPEKLNEVAAIEFCLTNAAQQAAQSRTALEHTQREWTENREHRNTQLNTIVQIARPPSAAMDIDQLLQRAAQLISIGFDSYHVGIYLVDETGEYAVLQASNSAMGQNMLKRSLKIKLAENTPFSVAAGTRRPYLVGDTNQDEHFLPNPYLPQTRSILVLPIQTQDVLIGILDLQSDIPATYQEGDIKMLEILTIQLALSIQNTRARQESHQLLQQLSLAQKESLQESWRKRNSGKKLSYRLTPLGVAPTEHTPAQAENSPDQDRDSLNIPINIRGQNLGTIHLRREAGEGKWTEEDRAFLEQIILQAAPAIENARLMEEIERRVQIERQIGQISARTQSSLDVETVIKTAVLEIGQALAAEKVQIRLDASTQPENEKEDTAGAEDR